MNHSRCGEKIERLYSEGEVKRIKTRCNSCGKIRICFCTETESICGQCKRQKEKFNKEYERRLEQGNRYMQTGNINEFKR